MTALAVEQRSETAADEEPIDLAAKPSVGVAPLLNLSNDPAQDYFVEGMTEDLVAALTRLRTISVVVGGSNSSSRGLGKGTIEAGRRLGVRYMLEGSLRKADDHVRIALTLVDVHDGTQIWAERIDETFGDCSLCRIG